MAKKYKKRSKTPKREKLQTEAREILIKIRNDLNTAEVGREKKSKKAK